MEKWNTKTYRNFKLWQKIIFWLAFINILSLWFWLFVSLLWFNSRKKDKQERKEHIVKGLYYFSIVLLIIRVLLLFMVFLI